MWFLSARKARRTSSAPSQHGTFRPRLEALEDRCLLSAGALDPTFGSGGTVHTPLSIGNDAPLVVQPDGKIVVGGSFNGQFALERFNSNGSVDTSFNGGNPSNVSGIVSNVLTANGGSISGLAIDANGNILAAGSAAIPVRGSNTPDRETAVARYRPDGSLDTSFGGKGYMLTNLNPYSKNSSGGGEGAIAVAIQGDTKIVVGAYLSTNNIWNDRFTLLRYNTDGTLDTTFGNQSPQNGISITSSFGGSGDMPLALALQADGKILLAGTALTLTPSLTRSMAVARYSTAGQLDYSFGSGGTVTLAPFGAQISNAFGVLVQSNGAIVLGGDYGTSTESLILARLKTNGQLDSTFANSGFATSSNAGGALAIAQGANGDLLAKTNDVSVAAFLPKGALDTSFGTGGFSTIAFADNANPGEMAVQRDGKIVVAGLTPSPSGGTDLARFQPSNTQIGWPTAAPNPVSAGTTVTLIASNIYDNAYPSTTVTQVSFYLDSNGNGTLEGGTDFLLGTATLNASTGVWTFNLSTSGWAKGTYTLFAQATDGSVLYDPISIQVTVN